MKVKLIIELELPNNTPLVEGLERASLAQLLFDTYVNYTTCSHLEDAMKWGVKSNEGQDVAADKIYKHHESWANVCRDAKWDFEVLK